MERTTAGEETREPVACLAAQRRRSAGRRHLRHARCRNMNSPFRKAATANNADDVLLDQNEKILKFSEPLDKILDLMVKNESKASNIILFDIYETIRTSEHYPCRLSQITGSSRKTWPDGLLFKKNWPWTDFFNYHLLAMKENGWIDRLFQQNMKKMKYVTER